MANHKSALKRHRQSLKRKTANKLVKSSVRTAIKKVRSAAEKGELEHLPTLYATAQQAIAKAATKGVYHKNNAKRKISRLALLLNKTTAA